MPRVYTLEQRKLEIARPQSLNKLIIENQPLSPRYLSNDTSDYPCTIPGWRDFIGGLTIFTRHARAFISAEQLI